MTGDAQGTAADAAASGLARRLQRIATMRAFQRAEAVFRSSGTGLIDRVVGSPQPTLWQHYPDGELVDPATGAQAYYHQHPAEERPAGEHGHFHLFVRPHRLAPGLRPLAPPPAAEGGDGEDGSAGLCHLVAIGVDEAGRPRRVFTTNQWVTGEAWYATADVVALLHRFTLDTARRDPLIGDWLTAAVHLLRGPIIAVILDRDAALGVAGTEPPPASRLADRQLEVLAERPVAAETLPAAAV